MGAHLEKDPPLLAVLAQLQRDLGAAAFVVRMTGRRTCAQLASPVPRIHGSWRISRLGSSRRTGNT